MAYHDGNLSDARAAFLAANGYTGSVNDQLLAWLNHNSGVTPGAGSVTHTGTGASVMTITGTPKNSQTLIVQVTKAGANLAAAPTYTSNAPDFNQSGAVVAAILFPTLGVTVHFTNASFVLGDTYKAVLTGPMTNLNDAWYQFFKNAGATGTTFNDLASSYLNGVTGLATAAGSAALSDLWREYWAGSYGPT